MYRSALDVVLGVLVPRQDAPGRRAGAMAVRPLPATAEALLLTLVRHRQVQVEDERLGRDAIYEPFAVTLDDLAEKIGARREAQVSGSIRVDAVHDAANALCTLGLVSRTRQPRYDQSGEKVGLGATVWTLDLLLDTDRPALLPASRSAREDLELVLDEHQLSPVQLRCYARWRYAAGNQRTFTASPTELANLAGVDRKTAISTLLSLQEAKLRRCAGIYTAHKLPGAGKRGGSLYEITFDTPGEGVRFWRSEFKEDVRRFIGATKNPGRHDPDD